MSEIDNIDILINDINIDINNLIDEIKNFILFLDIPKNNNDSDYSNIKSKN